MITKIARKYLRSKGFRVVGDTTASDDTHFIHAYQTADGRFDYDRYRAVQIAGNKRKIENVWADQRTIGFIADYLKRTGTVRRGLCHGVRRGLEQQWFAEALDADVIGTDISDTATQFPKTVQWDFHDDNPDWDGLMDFVYTNSHDHAYNPKKAIDVWVRQIAAGGCVLLEHTIMHSERGVSELDPFGVNPHVLPFLVAKWGAGRYAVTEILEPPQTKPNGLKVWIFVIRSLR